MSSNIYTAGLKNAGSYKVSGQPYITGSFIAKDGQVKIEFPYVAKNIRIRIPSAPNGARHIHARQPGGAHANSWLAPSDSAKAAGTLTPFGNLTTLELPSNSLSFPSDVNDQPIPFPLPN